VRKRLAGREVERVVVAGRLVNVVGRDDQRAFVPEAEMK
jgi:hypothetical protein